MRGTVRRHLVLDVPAGAVWDVVGRPELLADWFPGVEPCTFDGEVRTVTLRTGLHLDEHIVTNDPIQRRLQYRIVGGIFTEHLTTLDVIELDEHRCLVVYGADADPATMAVVLGGAMGAALEELRRQLETGET